MYVCAYMCMHYCVFTVGSDRMNKTSMASKFGVYCEYTRVADRAQLRNQKRERVGGIQY